MAHLILILYEWPQEKGVCDVHDDAMPLFFQLQVSEDFFEVS